MHGDCRKMLRTLVHILAASVFDMIFGASRKSASFSQKISWLLFANKCLFDNHRLLQIVLASEKQGSYRVWNSLKSMEIIKLVFQAEKKYSVKSQKNWKVWSFFQAAKIA